MNFSWLDLPDSTLKVRLDISLEEMEKMLETQKAYTLEFCAKEAEWIREYIKQQTRSGWLGSLIQLILGAVFGIDPSRAILDNPEFKELEDTAAHRGERANQAFSDSISLIQFLKRSIDMNDAVVRTCYQQLHGFLCRGERLDFVLLALSRECGKSSVEINIRKLLSDLAGKDTEIETFKNAIIERIDKTECEA